MPSRAEATTKAMPLRTGRFQEVSMGRTVHVPNLGLFFHAGTGQMRFKARPS